MAISTIIKMLDQNSGKVTTSLKFSFVLLKFSFVFLSRTLYSKIQFEKQYYLCCHWQVSCGLHLSILSTFSPFLLLRHLFGPLSFLVQINAAGPSLASPPPTLYIFHTAASMNFLNRYSLAYSLILPIAFGMKFRFFRTKYKTPTNTCNLTLLASLYYMLLPHQATFCSANTPYFLLPLDLPRYFFPKTRSPLFPIPIFKFEFYCNFQHLP